MSLSLYEKTSLVQRRVGATQDGVWGHDTADATIRDLGISVPVSSVRVGIDPGHGMSNARPGIYDTGCTMGALHEADVTLTWARALADALASRGVSFYLTRTSSTDDCPVSVRDNRAHAAGCTHFVSIHVNDAEDAMANGSETLYRDDKVFADRLQACLVSGLGLRNRGVKFRDNLAVLGFGANAALLELGFIKHPADRAAFMDSAKRSTTCTMIAGLFV